MSVVNNTDDLNASTAGEYKSTTEPSGLVITCNVLMMVCTTILNGLVVAFFCCSKNVRSTPFNKQILAMSITDMLIGVSLLGPILVYIYSPLGIPSHLCGIGIAIFHTLQLIGLSQILGICIQRLIILYSIDRIISDSRKNYFIPHFIASWIVFPIMVGHSFIRYKDSEENLKVCSLLTYFGTNAVIALYPANVSMEALQGATTIIYIWLWIKLKISIRQSVPNVYTSPLEIRKSSNISDAHFPLPLRATVPGKKEIPKKDGALGINPNTSSSKQQRALCSSTVGLRMQQRSLKTIGILLFFYNLFLTPLTVVGAMSIYTDYKMPQTDAVALSGVVVGNSLLNVFVYAFRTPELKQFLTDARQAFLRGCGGKLSTESARVCVQDART